MVLCIVSGVGNHIAEDCKHFSKFIGEANSFPLVEQFLYS